MCALRTLPSAWSLLRSKLNIMRNAGIVRDSTKSKQTVNLNRNTLELAKFPV